MVGSRFNTVKFISSSSPSSPTFRAFSTLLFALLFHIMITLGSAGRQHPYGVATTGIAGASGGGHDVTAGGYAGSSLVAPLASSGYNSPLRAYAPNPSPVFPGNSYGFGFGGYANNGGGSGGSSSGNSNGYGQSSGGGGRGGGGSNAY